MLYRCLFGLFIRWSWLTQNWTTWLQTFPPTHPLLMGIPVSACKFCNETLPSRKILLFCPAHGPPLTLLLLLFPGSIRVCLDSCCRRSECNPSSARQMILANQKKVLYQHSKLGILIWSLVNGQSESLKFDGKLMLIEIHFYNFYENGKKYFIFQIMFCWY